MDENSYDRSSFVAELYDWVTPHAERPDVDFYRRMALEHGGPVLELGCGTGRTLIPIAAAGVAITGIDASASMLARCRARVGALPADQQERVSLRQGDIRHFAFERRFRLITIPFHTFQYLSSVEEQLSCLGAVRRHLEPGGRLVFDLFLPPPQVLSSPPDGRETADEPTFACPDGRRVTRRHRVVERNPVEQTSTAEMIYYVTQPDGTTDRFVHTHRLRYLFRFEAEHLLARSGFAIEHLFAGFDGTTIDRQYPAALVFIARPGDPRQ